MRPGEVWAAVLLAFLVTVVATPMVRSWLVAREILDWPDDRRSHDLPTPRGGGLAMLLALAVTLPAVLGPSAELTWLLVYLGALGVVGWLDDRCGLAVGVRLLVMTACALGLLAYFGPIELVMVLGKAVPGPWVWSGLAVVAVVWLINLHNFMDGSDGLAALQGAWSGAVLGFLLYRGGSLEAGLAGLALAGTCLGFLVWNRPPARLFMGDVGSLLIGGLVGMLAYVGAALHIVSVWISLMVCAVFVVDATATLLRRAVGGGQWYTPHREHAYQRLIRSGWSHARVLGLYAALNLMLVLPLLTMALARPTLEGPLALVLVVLLLAAWTVAQRRSCTEDKIA